MWTRPMSARSCSRSTSVARSRPGSPRRATASTTSPSITTTSICPRNRRAAMVAEPERFNACEYLLDRRVKAGDGGRLAITGAGGQFSYAQLLDLVQRTAAGLRETGLEPEQRIVMFCSDGPAFAAVYLAAMRIGAIPVPVSTMLRAAGLAELLRDSRARLLAVTPEFGELAAEAAAAAPELRGILAAGGDPGTGPRPAPSRRRAGGAVRRHAVLRRADVLRQHAPRRAAVQRDGRDPARRVGGRGAARGPV